MKKVYTIIAIVAAVAIIIAAIFMFGLRPSASDNTTANGGGTQAASQTQTQAQTQAQGSSQFSKIYRVPTSTTLIVGTAQGSITINNFYKTALGAEDQYIVMVQNQNYEMTYDVNTDAFYLYIAQAPFDANRALAESAFTALLRISNADACKLNVEEGFAPGSTYGSAQLKLTFCTKGSFQAM